MAMSEKHLTKGFVQVYTGDGKGKTTAALGLAFRAAGYGMRTYIGQFMKGQSYGELEAARQLPGITVEQFGRENLVHVQTVTPEDTALARRGLERARQALTGGEYDIVILDEVNVALYFGLLEVEDVLAVIDARPEKVELVLTGRRAPSEIIDRADLVTEMVEVKHYYRQGVGSRDGIER
jgi:cob(I)alamin adenosyltransferase